jgi:hypothetical protein
MPIRTREWLEVLAKGLFWAAALVLVLSVIGAITVATGEEALVVFERLEEQSRASLAIASVAGGITGAGILAALGGILTILLAPREPTPFDPDA